MIEIRLPALRERAEDLSLLVENLLQHMDAANRPETALVRTNEFYAELARHSWPGNVRELRNYIERCLTLHEQTPLLADPTQDREPRLDPSKPLKEARETWTRVFERRYLEEVLRRNENNVTAAARAAGVDRIYFYRLLWRHGLR